ncbi:MAG: hypothetical protein J6D16_03465 [Clostridia bacterium]|nr:hypothetical protein [Clostridia bacterium]
MTEHKFTDEEVIKALETAIKIGDAPIGEHWACTISKQTAKDALDLINHQKAEIAYWMDEAANSKKEAVKEFAEKLKERLIAGGIYPVFVKNSIDNLVKEMMEGKE